MKKTFTCRKQKKQILKKKKKIWIVIEKLNGYMKSRVSTNHTKILYNKIYHSHKSLIELTKTNLWSFLLDQRAKDSYFINSLTSLICLVVRLQIKVLKYQIFKKDLQSKRRKLSQFFLSIWLIKEKDLSSHYLISEKVRKL